MNHSDIAEYKAIIPFVNGVIIDSDRQSIIKHDNAQKTWIELYRDTNELRILTDDDGIVLQLVKLTHFNKNHNVSDICISSDGSKIAFIVNNFTNDFFQGIYVLYKINDQFESWSEEQFIQIESIKFLFASCICFAQNTNAILVSGGEINDDHIAVFKFREEKGYDIETVLGPQQIYGDDNIETASTLSIRDLSAYNNALQVVLSLRQGPNKLYKYIYSELAIKSDEITATRHQITDQEENKIVHIEPNGVVRFWKPSQPVESFSFKDYLKRIIANTTVYDLKLLDQVERVIQNANGVKDAVEIEKLQQNLDSEQIKQPEEKEKMLRRHHLIVQHVLNNVAIAIKENQPIDFEMKSLEITEDRIKITGLKYSHRS